MESTMETVEFSAPDLDASDVEAVADVVRSGRLALGPKAVEFERAMAEYVGAKHAIAVNSGTAGLHLLVRCLGIGPGDEVIVPSFTFAASANAVLFERATPVFADIEPETLNLDPADVRRKITARTKAIMAVDVFGHPVEWDALLAVADEFGLKIIDDSCEALGAEYRGKKLGTFGHAAAFAFYPNKQMTTGEGGIIVTNDDAIAEMCRSLRNQGRHAMGTWLEHHHLGYNYRMPDICAALGCSQLARIETFLAKRAAVAAAYTERLQRFEWLRPPVVRPNVRMSWFVYVVTLAEGLLREPIMRAMNDMGIPTRAYFSPLHRQPYIRESLGPGPYELPVTDAIAPRTIALPFHNNLPLETIDRVVTALQTAVGRA